MNKITTAALLSLTAAMLFATFVWIVGGDWRAILITVVVCVIASCLLVWKS